MSFPTNRLVEEVARIPAVQQMKISVKSAVKSGAFVGAVTTVSGIVGGPIGVAIGGVLSSCAAYCMTKGQYEPVPKILLTETTPQQREKLAELLRSCINARSITTMRDFVFALQSNEQLIEAVVQILIMFLSSEMGRKVLV